MSTDRSIGVLLRGLQALDLQIDALQSEADVVPAQVAKWQDLIQAREIDKAMFLHQREDLVRKQRKFEGDIAQRQEVRGRYNQQLSQIKTNREYRALLEELDGVNTEIRGMEDIVLGAMGDIEAVDAELTRQDEAIQAVHTEIEAEKPRLEGELQELERQIGALRTEREGVAGQVEPRLLARYNRVRERRGGAAVAPLDPSHGVCGGCHMSLTPQEVNEILGGSLVACASCGRLLYHDEPAAESTPA